MRSTRWMAGLAVGWVGCSFPTMDPAVEAEALELAANVDTERLMTTVRELVAAHETETPTSGYDGPYRNQAGLAYLEQAFIDLGYTPRHERDERGEITDNLVVELPGASDSLVLLTAHHDVWYTAADDNGTGLAALLEAARAFRGRTPAHTIRFISFDREEDTDLLGSRRYYQAHASDDVRLVVNLDAIGYADRTKGSQTAPPGLALPKVADFIAVMANGPAKTPIQWTTALASKVDPPVPIVGVQGIQGNQFTLLDDLHRSDHAAAWARGIPALFFSDTTNFRSPHYHQASDLPGTLDPVFFHSVVELVLATTWVHANTVDTP